MVAGPGRRRRPRPGTSGAERVIAANLLFLSGVAAYSGSSCPMIARAGQREPEITSLMRIVGNSALRQPVQPHQRRI